MKSSSRAGRFKKKLVSEEILTVEAPEIEVKMAPFLELYHAGSLSSPELTAVYIILILSRRFPGTWLGSKVKAEETSALPLSLTHFQFEKNISERLKGKNSLGDVFAGFALKSTPLSVNRSILSWATGAYPLELLFRIPTPKEILSQQKRGRRCVSVLYKAQLAKKFILGERDALSFTLHDLIHADHFFHHNDCFQGQLGFYGLLDRSLCEGHFRDLMQDENFQSEFEYLIADMNAYAVHLMKCLKSAMIHYHPAKGNYFNSWVQGIGADPLEADALMKLNSDAYVPPEHDQWILRLCSRNLHRP